ncbi:uncharacterized protein N7515_005893 [Penicillium bovifimosum]|uniref:Uncharacterized protein n=1 Tax=Penicillium bovifimosum TaxID=126998 RepID=A0A9W9GTM0_9EURO|nr:uncharacterized protein N7515_005893 [Penicillium bovifimosum]KAJ5129854.1 hypothetical protein N7515_005893 [Penicillium bovifimosum]
MTEATGTAIDETIAMSPFNIAPRDASESSRPTKTQSIVQWRTASFNNAARCQTSEPRGMITRKCTVAEETKPPVDASGRVGHISGTEADARF